MRMRELTSTLGDFIGSLIILILIAVVCGTLLWVALPNGLAPITLVAWRNVVGLVFSTALCIRASKATWGMP